MIWTFSAKGARAVRTRPSSSSIVSASFQAGITTDTRSTAAGVARAAAVGGLSSIARIVAVPVARAAPDRERSLPAARAPLAFQR